MSTDNSVKDLNQMSNQELDALYASLARGCGNGEPNEQMREIEKIMSERYEKHISESSKK